MIVLEGMRFFMRDISLRLRRGKLPALVGASYGQQQQHGRAGPSDERGGGLFDFPGTFRLRASRSRMWRRNHRGAGAAGKQPQGGRAVAGQVRRLCPLSTAQVHFATFSRSGAPRLDDGAP
jgi:hypothetical protein